MGNPIRSIIDSLRLEGDTSGITFSIGRISHPLEEASTNLMKEVTPQMRIENMRIYKKPSVDDRGHYKISIGCRYTTIFQVTFTEYEHCCGKMIMSGIYAKRITKESYNPSGYISNPDYEAITNNIVELVEVLGKHLEYSSTGFILSEKENLHIYQEMLKNKKVTIVNEFVNCRSKHKLTEYNINF